MGEVLPFSQFRCLKGGRPQHHRPELGPHDTTEAEFLAMCHHTKSLRVRDWRGVQTMHFGEGVVPDLVRILREGCFARWTAENKTDLFGEFPVKKGPFRSKIVSRGWAAVRDYYQNPAANERHRYLGLHVRRDRYGKLKVDTGFVARDPRIQGQVNFDYHHASFTRGPKVDWIYGVIPVRELEGDLLWRPRELPGV